MTLQAILLREEIRSAPRRAGSLDPGRVTAADLDAVLADLDGASDTRRIDAVACALDRITSALVRHFPDNIFADLECLAGSLWKTTDLSQMHVVSRRVADLFEGFGCDSEIRFRYVHDFLYGFDWARWVGKDPVARAGTGPFDLPFIDYLERRQLELKGAASRGDRVLDVLEPGAYRNPFCFAREPAEEVELHLRLAELDLIPVKAWTRGGESRWNLPFTELRARIAAQLGFSKRTAI